MVDSWVGIIIGVGTLFLGFLPGGLQGRCRSKRARAEKVRDEHRTALGKLISPIGSAVEFADQFVEMCAEIEKDNPVPDETLSCRLRRIVEIWSGDVSPYVTDEAVRDAWRRADVAGLADRWDRARMGTDWFDVEGNLSRQTARELASETVAIDVRLALNRFRDAIRPYGLKAD